jgi:hypothetical protein
VSVVGLKGLNASKYLQKQLKVLRFCRINRTTGQIHNNVAKCSVSDKKATLKEITPLREVYRYIYVRPA